MRQGLLGDNLDLGFMTLLLKSTRMRIVNRSLKVYKVEREATYERQIKGAEAPTSLNPAKALYLFTV